ncbi:MAG: hypothetical protein H6679_01560 [Epsilonproteobacteria bacterium]|nr:hypothetical protein [Campylobacterota bacterium]
MNLKIFLDNASSSSFWQSTRVFCFTGPSYQPTFFHDVFKHLDLVNTLPAPKRKLDSSTLDKNSLNAQLSQTILGQQLFFLLGNIEEIKNKKQREEIITFLLAYRGPHYVTFFIPELKNKPSKDIQTIVLDQAVDHKTFSALSTFLTLKHSQGKQAIIKKIFSSVQSMSLDQACMLSCYIDLINPKTASETHDYVLRLLSTELPSLNQLSEHFFAKNAPEFFSTWTQVKDEYPDVFWVTFWSEQIWRAYHVKKFLAAQNFVHAKRMSYRLPYSFLNRHWKTFKLSDLADAYSMLYTIDYSIKRGSTFTSLDLFYAKHFLPQK